MKQEKLKHYLEEVFKEKLVQNNREEQRNSPDMNLDFMQKTSVEAFDELLLRETHQGCQLVLHRTNVQLLVPTVVKDWLYFKLVLYKPFYSSRCLLEVDMELLHPQGLPQLEDFMLHIGIPLPSMKDLDKHKCPVLACFLDGLPWKTLDERVEYTLEEKKLLYYYMEDRLHVLFNSSCHLRLAYRVLPVDCRAKNVLAVTKYKPLPQDYLHFICETSQTKYSSTIYQATNTDREASNEGNQVNLLTSSYGEEENSNPVLKNFRLMNSEVEQYNFIDFKVFDFKQQGKTAVAYCFPILPKVGNYFFTQGFIEGQKRFQALCEELLKPLLAYTRKWTSTIGGIGIVSKESIGVEPLLDSSHFIDSLHESSAADSDMGTLLSMFVAALLSRIAQLREEIAAGMRELAEERDTEGHSQNGGTKESVDTEINDVEIVNVIVFKKMKSTNFVCFLHIHSGCEELNSVVCETDYGYVSIPFYKVEKKES